MGGMARAAQRRVVSLESPESQMAALMPRDAGRRRAHGDADAGATRAGRHAPRRRAPGRRLGARRPGGDRRLRTLVRVRGQRRRPRADAAPERRPQPGAGRWHRGPAPRRPQRVRRRRRAAHDRRPRRCRRCCSDAASRSSAWLCSSRCAGHNRATHTTRRSAWPTARAAFTKLVPGFDFLQGLVKNAGAALPQHRPVGRADARPGGAGEAHRGAAHGAVLARAERTHARRDDPGARGAAHDAVDAEDDERADDRPARLDDAAGAVAAGRRAGSRPRRCRAAQDAARASRRRPRPPRRPASSIRCSGGAR